MTKIGSKIFGKTEGIKPRERLEMVPTRIKTSPGLFLDTQHRAAKLEAENAALRNSLVKISDLRIVEGRKRNLTDQEFLELKINLESFPLINPVTIRALPSGEYELISGHNRVQAFIELGRSEIEANVIDLAEEQVLPAAFYSNLLSPSLPDYEKYLGFKQLQEATGKSQSDLAKESGVSKAMISMLFAFDELSAKAHALLFAQPRLLSATLVNKFKHLPYVDEAIAKLASGDITHQQAMLIASQNQQQGIAVARTKPIVIKRGKQRFAEISTRGSSVTVKLFDDTAVPEFLELIENLVRQAAGQSEKSTNS
ncbi:MAG: ParB N-terminal domain-containing protein [Pseudomonadota bacterium]